MDTKQIIECPRCGSEEAYFDTRRFACPECRYRWLCPEVEAAEKLDK